MTRAQGLFANPNGEQQQFPDPADVLDAVQDITERSSPEVRDELERLIRADLLGPWDGDRERFAPRAMGPRERYLVGLLGPRPSPLESADDADLPLDTDSGAHDVGEAELPEILTPQAAGRMWASSMGLSFTVDRDEVSLAVDVSWGDYRRQEEIDADTERATRIWVREPVARTITVPLDVEPGHRIPLESEDPRAPGAYLAVDVRERLGRRVVRIVLVNARIQPEQSKDTAWIFQSRIAVAAADGDRSVFEPVDDPAGDVGPDVDDEELHLRLLYRHERRFASGHNVAVHAHRRDDEERAHRLETTWVPTFDVPSTTASASVDGAELGMDALAVAGADDLDRGLRPLVDGYSCWLERRARACHDLPPALAHRGSHAVHTAGIAATRIRAGVDLLTDPRREGHADALTAFRFANRVMALQRRHTALAGLRDTEGLDYDEALARVQDPVAATWRPFQLAFVLLNLPSLTDPDHPERAADPSALVDLLFFPTGGGKTEAYLGLAAYTFAIRRLQGLVGEGADARNGGDGVAVLMRYTLRLLTAQQFQRAAALVCAAEVVRREDPATWGDTPFRIGLWVGGGVSPNWFDEASEQITEAREAGRGRRVNVLQTLTCPWCGTGLAGHRDLDANETLRRARLYCSRGEGTAPCPFSRNGSAGEGRDEGVPVLTVDEEIYRYTPALVIATVDKLAQLPWRGMAGSLFGRVTEQCPRHGYRHPDLDQRVGCASRHTAKGRLPAVTARPVVRLRPPDLIIQDELHLISGALGTTVGLFESAVDELCTWRSPRGGEVGPKIVASTATTKRAREQVCGVFARELAIFPPQVLDVADNWFSAQQPTTEVPGRRYLGLCAHGVRQKSAQIRVAEILLLAGQTLLDRHGVAADPYLTMVGYYNATRELAGMRRYLDDDVAVRLRRHGTRKGMSNRLHSATMMLRIAELTSRISSTDISEALTRLETRFDPELDTSARRTAVGRNLAQSYKEGVDPHPLACRFRERDPETPVDAVLATSMLQVGVDVSRFGLMLVNGQPKNTAEYIQASSRVGRDPRRPGLVVTLYNWTRPRDLAHFEDFEHYHATFYRQVEPLSVTPYTRRSLDRTTAGALVAAIRHRRDDWSRNRDAQDVELHGPDAEAVIARMLTRAEHVGSSRARGYLEERINTFRDTWGRLVDDDTQRLGYEERKKGEPLEGLLRRAGSGPWGERTIAMSMRETENEINLLVGADLMAGDAGGPDWSFDPAGEDPGDDETDPPGDELGDSTPIGRARR
ncbi:DISARM system helicase DrmA [Pseudonocardia alni]|uniref:DISARM system helicase DrmA n=1 Tax=Pseudonocardia alni TaxID=33907 RepID=UPI0033CA5993